jgi:hypothetical protein
MQLRRVNLGDIISWGGRDWIVDAHSGNGTRLSPVTEGTPTWVDLATVSQEESFEHHGANSEHGSIAWERVQLAMLDPGVPWAPTSRAASSTLTGARPASDRPRDHRCDVSTSTLHRGYGCAAAQLAAVLISRTCRHQAVALTATLSPTSLQLGPTGGSSTPPPVAFRILLFHNMIHG